MKTPRTLRTILHALSAVAGFIGPIAANAQSISEDFNSGGLPGTMEAPVPGVVFSGGGVQFFLGPTRSYLRTIDAGFYNQSFVAEVTMTLGISIAWFGMGQGTPNPGFFDEPATPAINLRLHGTGLAGGVVHAGDNVANFSGPFNSFGNPGSGTHRLRLRWNAIAKTATFEIDQHYAGGTFTADFTSIAVNGADNGFTGTNTRIYFGGGEGVSFDDFSVSACATPVASAGADFAVAEGDTVALDGSGSGVTGGGALGFSWVQIPGGTPVTLIGADTASPTLIAPMVAPGGETLTFQLTVTAGDESATDTVSVTIVNVNHTPVADAGVDQTVAEGAPVTLRGEASFDIDNDAVGYSWVQVGGSPTVALAGANSVNPTFAAPVIAAGGAPGVVATLVFELRVDDGFSQDAPAPGFTFANVVDQVVVQVTNTNNQPVASAGSDQTVDENTSVQLDSSASGDPDGDALAYSWVQVSGPTVVMSGITTAAPTFTAPFVNAGGANLEFELNASDGYGGVSSDRVVIHVQSINDPPLAAAAQPTVGLLWPPNHRLVAVGITGVTDPNNNATITITGVTQDEPTNGLGDGDTLIDAVINADGTVLLRSERSGNHDGRVYRIYFTASDIEGSSSGVVVVKVPHSVKKTAIDSGSIFDSTH